MKDGDIARLKPLFWPDMLENTADAAKEFQSGRKLYSFVGSLDSTLRDNLWARLHVSDTDWYPTGGF
jgi:hypothetical protein